MVKKPTPPPLYYSQAAIEREKLEVLKRTERRISELASEAEAKLPQSSQLFTLAFTFIVLLLYTAYNISTQCTCACPM
jgi:hypothetical protein